MIEIRTQKDMANELGISSEYIYEIKKGVIPGKKTRAKLIEFYKNKIEVLEKIVEGVKVM